MSMSSALLRTKSIYGGRSISGMPGDVGNDFEVGLKRASHGGEHPTLRSSVSKTDDAVPRPV